MIFLSIGFVDALTANFSIAENPNAFVNLAVNTTFNISVGTIDQNISNLSITYSTSNNAFSGYFFITDSNGTSSSGANFTNTTAGSVTAIVNLTYYSVIPATGIVTNGTIRNFWFTLSAPRFASQDLVVINVTAINASGSGNSTTFTLKPAFTFTGYVVNETGCTTYYNSSGCWQNGTNVTIYGVANILGGPQTSTFLASALTNESGYFRLTNINASSGFTGYKLSTIVYSGQNATKVGTIMPAFPSFMYYGGGGGDDFQPAITLNISANNGTNQVSFGYEVVDQVLGFPIESNMQSKVYNASVVVPAGRAYVINIMRMFAFPGSSSGFQNDQTGCSVGDYMNDTHCPTPPKSQSISISQAVSESIINVNLNLSIRKAFVHGCVNPATNANNSNINITAIAVKMLPWTTSTGSFVPPSNANDGSITLANINYTVPGCVGYYNFSLLSGTSYMLEFYAKNASVEEHNPTSGTNTLAGFQNLTANDGLQKNLSMYKLVGLYYNTSTTGVNYNNSLIKIRIINSSGGVVTTNVNANIKIKNTAAGIGTVFYIINQITNGTFYMPVLNNSNSAKVMVFSQNGPPKETSINLSSNEVNITIRSMDQEKGFRKFSPNGSIETINTAALPITMRFLRTSAGCDVPNAPDSCLITTMNATSFNPLKALLAGKVNMEIKITSTNVSLIFKDYDMFSAKQPPMESVFDQNASNSASSGSSKQDTWNFGSFAPVDSYANVTVVIPYSDDTSTSSYLNESAGINVSIPVLYDENNHVIWNGTRGDSDKNLSDDFLDYNNTYYRNFTQTNGAACTNVSISNTCFINKSSNYLSIKVPHFSTIGAVVSGSGTTSSSSSGSSDSTGSNSGGGAANKASNDTWTNTFVYNEKEFKDQPPLTRALKAKERIKIKINSLTHYIGVRKINSNNVTIEFSSTPQQATLKAGESKKFDATTDGYYDAKVFLIEIKNNQANITISSINEKVESPQSENSTGDNNGIATNETRQKYNNGGTGNLKLILIIVVIVIVVIGGIVYYLQRKSKSKKY